MFKAADPETDSTLSVSRNASQEILTQKEIGSLEYDLKTDPLQDHRATEIKIWSFKGPHMAAFHASWIGFFWAFMAWFALPPLMPTIKKSLGLSQRQVYISNICALSATVGMRVIVGPLTVSIIYLTSSFPV
jgi:hypothetical protein